MGKHYAKAKWEGTLKDGYGKFNFTGYDGPFNFRSRFEDGPETSPEELVGAANAGCFSMFLSALISKKGFIPTSIETKATVELGQDNGPKITSITLDSEAVVPDLSEEDFNQLAKEAKANCPISRLFAGTEIILNAKLIS
ncbi:MAG: OsmC family peroxiredoxin [Melioribacteraceae bacterium]